MAKNFTSKDAQEIIKKHQNLLSMLRDVKNASEQVDNEIRQRAAELVSSGRIKKIILSFCMRLENRDIYSAPISDLIHSLYKRHKVQPTVDTAQSFYDTVAPSVKSNVALLKPACSGFTWLFANRKAKVGAEQAYGELISMLEESYCKLTPYLKQEVDNVNNLSQDKSWDAYLESPTLFATTLNKVLGAVASRKMSINPFDEQLSGIAKLEEKINACPKTIETDSIRKSAESMAAQAAMRILRGIPVEELNRNGGGFRIKALKDAGYTTLADIYAASSYQLSSVYGVSENAAFSIKRTAAQFLSKASSDVKIKLSADDRNKQSTELVTQIYLYRKKKSYLDELTNLVETNRLPLDSARDELNNVSDGLEWLFYSEEQRVNVRNSYDIINYVVNGEYTRRVTVLTDSLRFGRINAAPDIVWDDFKHHNIEYISILEDIVPGLLGNDDGMYGLPEDLAREIQEEVFFPDGLLCTLRRYQEWGVKYILHQKKVLLGDEMGLGKTVQAIAAMVSLRNTKATHFMVVCPASVVTNWCREVSKHSMLRATKIHGAGRRQALKSWIRTGGVAITTYETTTYLNDNAEFPETIDLLVVDEAHFIKNIKARRSVNVRALCDRCERLLFMTGTALENNVDEMISLIDVLRPDIASSVRSMTFMPNAPQFRSRVAPVYYRRKRDDVLTELPDLIETKEWCSLNEEEKALYERNVLSRNTMAARRLSWDIDDLKKSCKANRLLEIIDEAEQDDRKVIVFSFFLETIRAIGSMLSYRCYGPINGSVPPIRRQEIIDSFDSAPAGAVLLAQIQSGGTGLNIQSASVVVICEPQFKPSIENQAISRAYRMGQSRNVFVHRLLCENTIDEKITEILERKQEIFDAFADKSVAAEYSKQQEKEMDEKKFSELIQEEIDRICKEKGIDPNEVRTNNGQVNN